MTTQFSELQIKYQKGHSQAFRKPLMLANPLGSACEKGANDSFLHTQVLSKGWPQS